MTPPARVRIRRSEIGSRGRDLLALAARLRKVDRRHAELAAEQHGLVRDRNAEVARRDAARAALTTSRQIGWVRTDVATIDADGAADALEVIRCAEITIRCLNKILVQNRRHLVHLETTRRALRLLVKKS
jgi:hypothetical protein